MRWRRSFRTRVVVLVGLLTAVAIAVTVWVTIATTSQSITDSVEAQQQDLDVIVGQLRDYGTLHGTWIGVPDLAEQLRGQTGLRIKLTTEYGEVIVDTDTLEGRTARPPSSVAPLAVIPRPALDLTGVAPSAAPSITLGDLASYRTGVSVAACVTGVGLPVPTLPAEHGITGVAVDDPTALDVACGPPPADPAVTAADRQAVATCGDRPTLVTPTATPAVTATTAPASSGAPEVAATPSELQSCLQSAFRSRTVDDGAVTLLLDTGVRGSAVVDRDTARILYAAIPVLLLAIAVAVLLARRALRPVDAVIRASERFAAGERSTRVRVRGRDEMAALAESFNGMAASVQRGEEQQRSMVADVAHELRTPLANIRGYVEALRDGVLPASREVFESLHEEALLQQRVIDDLQDLALADRQTLVAERVRTDLGDLVRTVRSAHAILAEAVGVRLRVGAPDPVPADVDPDRLRQAVGNLVTNALRATAEGGTVTVRAVPDPADGGGARIEVADTGHGIAPEQLAKVFDRFWRAEPSRARSTGGSGLGLAITREIVRGHGGTIEVSSIAGVGTVFTVRIPAG